MKIDFSWLALGVFCLALSTPGLSFAEGNAEAGSVKFEGCVGCHAKPGYANAVPRFEVPKLGGQQVAYLFSALKAYAAGDRQHPGMHGNAESLSEQDMQDIAAYLGGLQLGSNRDNISGNPGSGKDLTAACSACHGENGNSSDPNFPRLAGQYQSYLIKAIEDYQNGKRNNPIMAGMAQTLGEDDIENIAAYYASQNKGLIVVKR